MYSREVGQIKIILIMVVMVFLRASRAWWRTSSSEGKRSFSCAWSHGWCRQWLLCTTASLSAPASMRCLKPLQVRVVSCWTMLRSCHHAGHITDVDLYMFCFISFNKFHCFSLSTIQCFLILISQLFVFIQSFISVSTLKMKWKSSYKVESNTLHTWFVLHSFIL